MPRALTKKDRQGMTLIGASVAVLLALFSLNIFLRDPLTYDERTFCPHDAAYPHTIVLIDKTDPFSASQSRYVIDMLNGMRRRIARLEKLSIYVLDDVTYQSPVPTFAMCNPGSGKDANQLYQNPARIEAKFREFFGRPLESTFQELLTVSEAPRSPILEMIREIALISDFEPARPAKRLIIVSDLLQNMPQFSQYRRNGSYDGFAGSAYAQEVAANLTGVDVEILYLWRPKFAQVQGRAHLLFWERYFANAGAHINEIIRVP